MSDDISEDIEKIRASIIVAISRLDRRRNREIYDDLAGDGGGG